MNKNNVKIGVVTWTADIGGAESFSLELTRALRSLEIDATLIALAGGYDLLVRAREEQVPAVHLGFRRGRGIALRSRSLARCLSNLGADGLIVQGVGFLIPLLKVAGYDAPIVAVEHGRLHQREHWTVSRRIKSRFEYAAAHVGGPILVTVSDYSRNDMRAYGYAEPIHRIYNGIGLGQYQLSPPTDERRFDNSRPLVIGVVGRFDEGKGQANVLHALRTRGSEGNVRIRFAGTGPTWRQVRALADSLGLGMLTSFEGRVSDIPEFWAGCDLAVMPSTSPESFGLAALEASASGRAVIASRVGALPEIVVHEETGLLVSPGSPIELGAAIARFLDTPELLTVLGGAGQRRAKTKFDIHSTAAQYADLLRGR